MPFPSEHGPSTKLWRCGKMQRAQLVGTSAWYGYLRAFAAAVLGLRGSYSSLATQSQIPFSLAFPRCLFTSEDSTLILRIILA